MAWIESHQSLGAHPKTKKLARLLNISVPTAIGHLHMLWWWALDYAQDGNLARYQVEDIADAVLWEGSPSLLVSSLLDAGFLEHIDGNPTVHDWPEYGGKLIAKRKADADRKARAANRADIHATSGGTPVELLRQSQVEKSTVHTVEKSTEENIQGEPSARAIRHKPIDEAFIAELQAEHPSVNVLEVYERAQNRKTWDGYKDKRRALRDHVGYAIQGNANGNHRSQSGRTSGVEEFAAYRGD